MTVNIDARDVVPTGVITNLIIFFIRSQSEAADSSYDVSMFLGG